MAIDETGLSKGQVRKLNALRKSVGDDLAEEVFAKWLERAAALSAKSKPDPVAMKIVEALADFENDPKFNLGRYGYTLRRAKGKGASGLMFSRRSTYSQRASSTTSILLSDGMALKSKLSRLLTAGNLACLIRRSTIRRSRVDQFQFSEADEIAHMVGALGGALAGQLVVLAQKGRQLQGLEVMDQQQLRRIGHDEPPPNRLI